MPYRFVRLMRPALPRRQSLSAGKQQMARTTISQPARDLKANTAEAARYEIARVGSARKATGIAQGEPLKTLDIARPFLGQGDTIFAIRSDDLDSNPSRRRRGRVGGIDIYKTTPALRVLLRHHSPKAGVRRVIGRQP
jgi:hypothetical protein